MKYLLIMQTQTAQRQVIFEESQSDLRIFLKAVFKLTKMRFMF